MAKSKASRLKDHARQERRRLARTVRTRGAQEGAVRADLSARLKGLATIDRVQRLDGDFPTECPKCGSPNWHPHQHADMQAFFCDDCDAVSLLTLGP